MTIKASEKSRAQECRNVIMSPTIGRATGSVAHHTSGPAIIRRE
jgi:hypothetical protein